jgi:hypothetical protein
MLGYSQHTQNCITPKPTTAACTQRQTLLDQQCKLDMFDHRHDGQTKFDCIARAGSHLSLVTNLRHLSENSRLDVDFKNMGITSLSKGRHRSIPVSNIQFHDFFHVWEIQCHSEIGRIFKTL